MSDLVGEADNLNKWLMSCWAITARASTKILVCLGNSKEANMVRTVCKAKMGNRVNKGWYCRGLWGTENSWDFILGVRWSLRLLDIFK